jgi:hypothetical protein
MKTLKFSIDKSALSSISTSYEKSRELIVEPFEAARLFDYITLLENIKSGDLLPAISFNLTFVAGGCGYQDGGSLAVSNVAMITKELKSDLTLCPKDLVGTAYERFLPAGVNMEDLGSVDDVIKTILIGVYAKAIQNMALTGVAGTNSIDGIVTRAYASTTIQEVTGTAPTVSDALTKLFAIYQKMDTATLSADMKPVILVGSDWLRMAAMQAFNDNRLAYNFQIDGNNGFTLPTTNVRVQGFDALNGTNKALAGSGKMIFAGTDLKDDMAILKYWWSEDNQEIRSTIHFRLGTALAFDNKMVRYKVEIGGGGSGSGNGGGE